MYEMYRSICRYIQENDRNSDIMDAYQEFEQGEIPFDVLQQICYNVLVDWKDDLLYSGMTKREKDYYEFLGIEL